MANEPIVTLVGNLVADPEVRATSKGVTVVSFTVASTPRFFRRETNSWEEGETLFMNCSVWRELGDHVVETLQKGMRVIVQGKLTQRSWSTPDGQKRSVVEMTVDEVGPSLRYAIAQVTKTSGQNTGGYGNRQNGYGNNAGNYGGSYSGSGYGFQGQNQGNQNIGGDVAPWDSNPAGMDDSPF